MTDKTQNSEHEQGGANGSAIAVCDKSAEVGPIPKGKTWQWSTARRLAAVLAAGCRYSDVDIAKRANISLATYRTIWKEAPEFRSEVLRLQRETGLAVQEEQLERLKTLTGTLGEKLIERIENIDNGANKIPLKDHVRLYLEGLGQIRTVRDEVSGAIANGSGGQSAQNIYNVIVNLNEMNNDELARFRERQATALAAGERPSGVYEYDIDEEFEEADVVVDFEDGGDNA